MLLTLWLQLLDSIHINNICSIGSSVDGNGLSFASKRNCLPRDVVTFWFFNQNIFRPDVSELESKFSEQSKILLNLQQKVDDLASKVY